ncbi:MAG TPA: hypothetical protein VJ725_22695 [Thermoanaerobaculia bacterium]|nr:hypothetical protein [Thermoanaerobaculia bacterium]
MASGVWPELREQVAVEESQLQQLLDLHRPLLEKCLTVEPDAIELSALAARLHSFYTGIENLFRRIALELDGGVTQGSAWHQRLLRQMMEPGTRRPAVLSAELHEQLQSYLQFRHVFRSAYSFQLHWDKMAPLVLHCEEVFSALRSELASFKACMDTSA